MIATKRKLPPSRHNSSNTTNIKMVKRAFLVYLLLASCLVLVIHQFRQSHKVTRWTSKNDRAFLPKWSLNAAWNAWWHTEEETEADLDDDNVYNDDDDDDEDPSTEDSKETVANAINTTDIEAELRTLRREMDHYARAHGGQMDRMLMLKYQRALRRKRGRDREQRAMNRQERQQQFAKNFPLLNMTNAQLMNQSTGGELDLYNASQEQRSSLIQRRKDKREEKKRKVGERRAKRISMYKWKPPGHTNETDYTNYPILPTDRRLPDMSETGGVIFFLHVPKTGGQTLRQLNLRFRKHLRRKDAKQLWKQSMEKQGSDTNIINAVVNPKTTTPEEKELLDLCQERLRFVVANTRSVFLEHAVPRVNARFNKNNTSNQIIFVEVHGMDNYDAFELEPFLQYWREQSKASGVPFFAFTLLREALSLQVSFFNYYYIHPGDPRFCINPLKPQQRCGGNERLVGFRKPPGGRRPARLMGGPMHDRRTKKTHENGMEDMSHKELEDAMLQVAYENPQCLFLARGERSFGDDPDQVAQRTGLGRNECQSVYLSLQRTMDWIGTTDKLNAESLPLLANLMFRKPYLGKHLPKANVSPHDGGWMKLSRASESTIKRLDKISQLDQELYHRVKEDYTLDQWDRTLEVQ